MNKKVKKSDKKFHKDQIDEMKAFINLKNEENKALKKIIDKLNTNKNLKPKH